jgi:hypothetical protein
VSNATFYAKRLNRGQSEIYINSNGKESTHRVLPTNELFNNVAFFYGLEETAAFYEAMQVRVGSVATLTVGQIDVLAAALRLVL